MDQMAEFRSNPWRSLRDIARQSCRVIFEPLAVIGFLRGHTDLTFSLYFLFVRVEPGGGQIVRGGGAAP